MNSFTDRADENEEKAKRATNDNFDLGERDLRRRPPMESLQIDHAGNEGYDDDDDYEYDDDEYDDMPLVVEGSAAEARNQKSLAVNRENRIVGVSLLIGMLVALIFAVTSSGGSYTVPAAEPEPSIELAASIEEARSYIEAGLELLDTDTTTLLSSMATNTKQGPANTAAAAAAAVNAMVPNPYHASLDEPFTCALQSPSDADKYWAGYVHKAFGTFDRCGALPPAGQTCRCLHPGLPVPRRGPLGHRWFLTFQRNLRLIAATVNVPASSSTATAAGVTTATATDTANLDVVLLGDSITEHWLGTDFGVQEKKWKEHYQVYQELFQNNNNRDDNDKVTTSGLALGIGGDMCPHLQYRLLNGEMANLESNETALASRLLQPAVWWVLIGTNDVGAFCEAEQIVTGTIQIVQQILDRRPASTVVVNSILPRTGRNGVLSHAWYTTVTTVNRQMECYAASLERVEFFNATDYFIRSDNGGADDAPVRVNMTLMTDNVHPSAAGYRIWGQGIVDRVQEIKERQRRSKT
jgi:lysophospholipase L1-like esterase